MISSFTRNVWILIAAMPLLLVAGCLPTSDLPTGNDTTPASFHKTEWLLSAYGTAENLQTPVSKTPPDVTFYPAEADVREFNEVGGFLGCNYFGGRFQRDGDQLGLSDITTTSLNECQDAAVLLQEGEVLAALRGAESYAISGDVLIIHAVERELRFQAEPPPPITPLTGSVWLLETAVRRSDGQATSHAVPEWLPVTAAFADGQISGSDGCNSYGGSYHVEGEQFSVGEIARTAAGCEDETINLFSELLLTGLTTAERFTLDGERLTIHFPGGELIFRAKAVDEAITQADEQAIYAAVLRESFGLSGELQYVIGRQTVATPPGVTLDAAMEQVAGELGELLDPTAVADFSEKNSEPQSLEGLIALPLPTTFLEQADIEALGGNWARFQELYPNTPAIVSFSRIGFSDAGDQALLYYTVQLEDFSGGYYALLLTRNDFWGTTRGFLVWEK
jgi:heat shock protein HslJ